MNHININQDNRITEYSTNNILESLYKLFSGTDIPTDINEIILDNTSELEGNITVQGIYEYQYNWLLEQLPKLRINYTTLYFYVKDPYIKSKLLENNFGDNNGHLLCERVFAATSLPVFGSTVNNVYETNITSFDELSSFTNVTTLTNNFQRCQNLESIDLKNIKDVGSAFIQSGIKYCYNSDKVEIVSGQCFYDCQNLEEFDFSSVKQIGWLSFNNCSKLKEAHFNSNNNINFEAGSFRNCSLLETVDGLDSQTSLFSELFQNCTSLKQMNLPNVEQIGTKTFNNCSSLHTVYAPKTNKIEQEAFRGCSSLTNLTVDWNHITTLGVLTFQDCKFESVDLSNVTTFTGTSIFQNCTKLRTIGSLNSELKSITADCFNGCSLLEEIDLSNIEQLYECCFKDCTSLSNIGCDLSNIIHINSTAGQAFKNCSSLQCQINLTGLLDSVIPNLTFQISGITSFTGSQYITKIGSSVFEECRQLTSFNCPNVTIIDGYAFKNCTSLSTFNAPNLKTIGIQVFFGCNSLTSLGNCKPTTIYQQAFVNANTDSSFEIDLSECEYIGLQAFNNCGIGPNINLSSLTPLDYGYQFANTSKLKNVIWSNTLTTMPGYMFENSSVESVTNTSALTTIYIRAFNNCQYLTSIDLSNVEYLDSFAFNNCQRLVTIGNTGNLVTMKNRSITNALITTINLENVEEIGGECFYDCSNLTGPLVMNKIKTLGPNLFRGCNNLSYIVINVDTLPTKDNNAFGIWTATFLIYIKDDLYDEALSAWSSTESNLSQRLKKLSTLQ